MGASKTILYTERFGSKADRRVLLTALRHFVGDDRSRPHPPVFGNGATRPTHQRGRDGERPRQYLMIGVVEPITALTAVAVTMMIVMAGAPVARNIVVPAIIIVGVVVLATKTATALSKTVSHACVAPVCCV